MTYDEARSQTTAAMQAVVDLLPAGSKVTPRPEDEPYPCSDSVGLVRAEGDFYTGDWDVVVPGNFDVAAFVSALPQALGDGWTVRESQIPLNIARVRLTQSSTSITVTVTDTTVKEQGSLQVLAMSPCAQRADE